MNQGRRRTPVDFGYAIWIRLKTVIMVLLGFSRGARGYVWGIGNFLWQWGRQMLAMALLCVYTFCQMGETHDCWGPIACC